VRTRRPLQDRTPGRIHQFQLPRRIGRTHEDVIHGRGVRAGECVQQPGIGALIHFVQIVVRQTFRKITQLGDVQLLVAIGYVVGQRQIALGDGGLEPHLKRLISPLYRDRNR